MVNKRANLFSVSKPTLTEKDQMHSPHVLYMIPWVLKQFHMCSFHGITWETLLSHKNHVIKMPSHELHVITRDHIHKRKK